jgi:proteasome component ECM29
MNLASHHSLWNSKKGAAFAATSIMAQAQDQIAPILPTLVPKLYRSCYDPNPRISASMNNILKVTIYYHKF